MDDNMDDSMDDYMHGEDEVILENPRVTTSFQLGGKMEETVPLVPQYYHYDCPPKIARIPLEEKGKVTKPPMNKGKVVKPPIHKENVIKPPINKEKDTHVDKVVKLFNELPTKFVSRDINSFDFGNMALHQIVRERNIPVLKHTLNLMEDEEKVRCINAKDEEGLAPIHYAAKTGELAVVLWLHRHGADVSLKDDYGATPLHHAARRRHYEMQGPDDCAENNEECGDGTSVYSMDSLETWVRIWKRGDEDLDVEEMKNVFHSIMPYLRSCVVVMNARDKSGSTALHYAAMMGNTKAMDFLLGIPDLHFEAADNMAMTPLHVACSHNQLETSRMLLEKKVNPRCCDQYDRTALHYACMEGNLEMVKLLLKSETDDKAAAKEWSEGKALMLQDSDRQQNTPLHNAVERNSVDVVQYCLQGLQDSPLGVTRAVNANYQTPLHIAARHGNKTMVELLLYPKHNDPLDINMETPLYKAAAANHPAIVKLLIDSGADVNRSDRNSMSPLLVAAKNGYEGPVKILLFNRARYTDKDKNDRTALFWAAQTGKSNIIKILQQASAMYQQLWTSFKSQNKPDSSNQGKNPSNQGKKPSNKTQKLFLEMVGLGDLFGEKFNRDAKAPWKKLLSMRDRYHNTPLHVAAEKGNIECVRVLMELSDEKYLHAKNEKEQTPLHVASEAGQNKVVREFLGLKVESPLNSDDKPPTPERPGDECNSDGSVCIPKDFFSWDCVCETQKCTCNAEDSKEKTTEKSEDSTVQNVVKHPMKKSEKPEDGTNNAADDYVKNIVNAKDEYANTPMHVAAGNGYADVILSLCEKGGDLQARNTSMWTPLDCAAWAGQVEVCKTLLSKNAQLNPIDKVAISPLHLACAANHPKVIELLLSKGADPGLRLPNGKNCLDLAIDHFNHDVASKIIESKLWKCALRNETEERGKHVTPMRKLIKRMPDLAEKVLSKCIERTTTDFTNPNHEVTFNFEFIDDTCANWKEGEPGTSEASGYDANGVVSRNAVPYTTDVIEQKINHPVMMMVTHEREKLVKHPTVLALLALRWRSYGCYTYYANLLTYIIYVIFLTGYMCTATPPYELNFTDTANCSEIPDDYNNKYLEENRYGSRRVFVEIGKWIIIAIASLNLFSESINAINSPVMYFKDMNQNAIELLTYIFSIALVMDFCPSNADFRLRQGWQWQIGSISIFLCWMTMMLYLQKTWLIGIYIRMVIDVFKSFMKFLPVALFFIMAFALSFYALMQNRGDFDSVGISVLKTSVMMVGELDFSAVFVESKDATVHDQKVFYYPATCIVFVLFMSLCTIILMNLLVGLAVDDISGVQQKAVLNKLALQVHLVLDVGPVLPFWIKRKFQRQNYTIKPHEDYTFLQWLMYMKEDTSLVHKVADTLENEAEEDEKVTEGLEALTDKMTEMQKTLEELKCVVSKLKK